MNAAATLCDVVREMMARRARLTSAYRAEVQADVEYHRANPDGTRRAREPVYRGWFLAAADVEFVPAE